jgi:hypothetical protein
VHSRLSKALVNELADRSRAGLAAGRAKASRIGSRFREEGAAARERFEALPSPWQAALRSCLFGGAGQIALGQKEKGALIVLLAIVVLPLAPIVVGFGIYDAYVMAGRLQTRGRIGAWEFFWHKAAGASWTVVRVEPLGITEEFIGTETVRVDNHAGRRSVNRSLTIQKEWFQSYVIEHEKAQTTSSQFQPTVTNSTVVKRTVENLYREKYSYTQGRKQVVEERVAVEVPARRSVCLELRWKHILDNWLLVMANDIGEQAKVPVYVVTKLSFDQRIVNVE